MKRIALLGSTGSIGQNTLEIIRRLPKEFKIVGLSANTKIDILYKQIKRFSPKLVAVGNENAAVALKKKLGRSVKLLAGEDAAANIALEKDIDLLVLAISGSAALTPLINAIDNAKDIALANKEALVMAGNIIMRKAKVKRVKIFPIDSEQSAIWQCLDGRDKQALRTIYLTASGGPLYKFSKSQLKKITQREVLNHPRWKMGKKITVDSATLMNKGLEVIEAMHLFAVDIDKIKVLIHPEAIVHSMVEFIDGSILAQLSATDMRIPIQYAMTYPRRLPTSLQGVNFFKLGKLMFLKPDFNRFPCLKLAYKAASEGGSAPAALNAANGLAVEAFLEKDIDYLSIPEIIEKVLSRHRNILRPKLRDIFYTHAWARQEARCFIAKLKRG